MKILDQNQDADEPAVDDPAAEPAQEFDAGSMFSQTLERDIANMVKKSARGDTLTKRENTRKPKSFQRRRPRQILNSNPTPWQNSPRRSLRKNGDIHSGR